MSGKVRTRCSTEANAPNTENTNNHFITGSDIAIAASVTIAPIALGALAMQAVEVIPPSAWWIALAVVVVLAVRLLCEVVR